VAVSTGSSFDNYSSCGITSLIIFVFVLGDVNGDGKADLVQVTGSAAYVKLSTGTSFLGAASWCTLSDQGDALVGDVDGDGKADLVLVTSSGTEVALSTGSAFGALSTWSGVSGAALLGDVDGH
jgi:hypothetical protein